MRFRAYAASHPGMKRDHNEDSFLVAKQQQIYALADGMGGHAAGEVASGMFTEIVDREIRRLGTALERKGVHDDEKRRRIIAELPQVVQTANADIFAESQRNPTRRGMGTTGILFLPTGEQGYICHVGDSRLYLFRNDELHQITEDHSYVIQLIKAGKLTHAEAEHHPLKNVVMQCIGTQATVKVDTLYLDIAPGDQFLLCSDGLSDMVSPPELAAVMAQYRGADLVKQAIAAANRNGGMDNITVLVVEAREDRDVPSTITDYGVMKTSRFIRKLFLFASLTEQEAIKVNRVIYHRSFPPNAEIIAAGDRGKELFFVREGTVEVWKGDTYLTRIGQGGHFGELGLFGDATRSASVIAATQCELMVINADDLQKLIAEDQTLGNKVLWAFLENLSERVRDLSSRLSRR